MGYSQDLLVNNLNEFGKARANPYACPPNNLKLSDSCDCNDLVICRDSFYLDTPGANTLASVIFNGVTYTVDAPVLDLNGDERHPVLGGVTFATEAERDRIKAWLEDIVGIMEIDIKIDIIEIAPDEHRVVHYGAYTLESLTLDTFGAADEARCCDAGTFYQYKLSKEGAMLLFNWDGGSDNSLTAGSPYDYTGVPATDAATAASILAAVIASLGALAVPHIDSAGGAVQVTVDDINGLFVITYWTSSDIPGDIDGDAFTLCDRKVDFLCAYA